jgi:tetratricopeptide (TPR) repeat protein
MSIFWIHAATPDRFHQGYLEIARRCQIPGCEDQASDALQLVKDWLENQDHGKWLMVIDNADNEAAFFETGSQPTGLPADVTKKKPLKYYIPRCTHGSVLVTTRDKAVAVSFTGQYKMRRIEVAAMSKAESRELLHGILSDETIDSELDELINLLDNLPLALVQAGSYIEKTSSSIEDYLEIYHESEDSALDLLDQEFESDGRDLNIPNAVVTSWIISFEQIQVAQPRAAEILSLMAFFDRQAIPESLLRDQDEPLSSFKDSIGKLLAYSLITRSIDKKHFDEHRLAHMISQAWLKRNGNAEKWLIISQERILKRFPKDEYKDWIVCISYLPHARVAINRELENTSGIYNQSISWLMFWVTRFLMFQGSYLLMMEISKQHSDYCLKHLGSKHSDTLFSIDNLAQASHYLGEYKEAEKLQRQVLEGREKLLGPEHPNTLLSISNLALALSKQGQYKEGEKLHWQALEGREKLLGPEHPDTLWAISNLASVLSNQGQYKKAEKLYWQAIKGGEKLLGPEHPDTLQSISNLATVLSNQGQYKKAEKLYWQALESREKLLGPEHPDTLRTISNLATVLSNQGQYKEAEKLCWQVLEGTEKLLGPEHPDTLRTISNLATVLSNQGQYKKAEKLYWQALEGREKLLGPEHPDTLWTISNLATVLSDQGQYKEAEKLYQQAIKGMEKLLGSAHPNILLSVKGLTRVLESQGRSEEAQALENEWALKRTQAV